MRPQHSLWEHLAALVHDDGYTLDRGPCPPEVNGYTDIANKRVRVRDDVDAAQAVKTLAHELGFVDSHTGFKYHIERSP